MKSGGNYFINVNKMFSEFGIDAKMFNNRLTFLQQCMRQGPSLNGEISTQNLAFGRPPICILRIGDFYHTKMIIQNLINLLIVNLRFFRTMESKN